MDDIIGKLNTYKSYISQGSSISIKSKSPQPIVTKKEIIKRNDAKSIINTLTTINKNTSTAWHTMDEYLTYLESQGKGYVKNYVKECQNQVYLTDDLIEASKKARQAQLDHNQAIRQSTAAYKIAATAKKAFAMAGNMAAMWAISKAVSAVTKTVDELVHAQENLENSAGSLGSELSSKTADIGSYKDKIKELYQTIQDDSSSISEVTQARVNLMAVQDELINKFGTEKGAIENITQAISGQTAALDELSRQSYFQAKNEFNKKTGGQKFGDWLTFGNTNDNRVQSNMDTMIHQMESHFYQLKTTGNEVLDSLIAKSYGLNIMDDMYGDGQHFQLMGSLEEIQQKLYGIQVMAGDFEVSPAFENSFTDISTEVDTSLAKFRDLYGQYVLWEKILNAYADNPYDEQFHLINTAKESYNEAVLSGNEENISQMGDHYAVILTDAMKLAMENNDKDVADYFRAMYPELQQTVGNWQFRVDFEADSDGLKASLSEILDMTDGASDGVTSFSAEDFENFNPSTAAREQIDAYGELIHMAASYGLTLSQLIQYLQQLGLVQSEAYQNLVTLFGKDNVDKISQDDLTFAYKIEDAGKMTFEEFREEIQKIKDLADESVPIPYENLTKSTEHAAKAVAALRSSLTAVNDAFGEQAENGGISVDTMLSLVDAGYAAALEFDAVTGACSLNRDAMLDLVQAKIHNQILDLDSLRTDIQTRLAADGNAASQAANGFYDLVRAKSADAAVDQIMVMEQFNSAGAQINALRNALSNLDKIGTGSYTTSFKPGFGSGKGASQDPLMDAFTREHNTLKHNQEMEFITNKEYYDSLKALNRKYFAGREEYLEEYRKYEKEVLDGLRAYNKEMTEARMNLSEKQLDAGIISYEDYCKTVISLIDEMYAQDRISAEDHFDYMQKVMEKQLGIYDMVLASVNRRLDKEIDKNQAVIDGLEQENDVLEKQQDRYDKIISAIHNTLQARKEEVQSSIDALDKENKGLSSQLGEYDSVLRAVQKIYEVKQEELRAEQDAIQERMDALRDENEENQKAIDLQKARYELQRSMNQRTKLMFNGDQFVYSADSSAVRDNWENVEALELEQTISSMEKEKEALQELISELDRYKNLWAEISGSYQDDQDREAADSILGENFGQEILLNRIEDIEAFRDRYVAAQSQIDDNTNMIESYEEKLLYYDSLGMKWDEISSLHEESINRQLASEQFGAEWETLLLQDRLEGFEEFRNSYLGIQEQLDDNTLMIASYNEKIAYYQDLKEQWASIADTCQNSVEDQYASMILGSNWEADVLSGRMDTLNRFKNDYVAIQLAMAQADVDRYNIQVEAASNASKNIKTSDASISNGPQVNSTYRKASSDITTGHSKRPNILLKRFGDGGVITDSAAGSLDWLAQMAGEDHIIIASNNERVLTEGQNQLFEKLGMSAPPVIANPIKDLPRFTFPEPQREKSLSLHIGEINMNNVQDVDGFARAIERELPLCMLQMLHTK